MLLKGDSAPFGIRGKGNDIGGLPVRILFKMLRHSTARIIIRIHIVIKCSQHFRYRFLREIFFIQQNKMLHIHPRLSDSTGFIHTQRVHTGKDFHTVHIPHKNLPPGKTQNPHGNSDAGQ